MASHPKHMRVTAPATPAPPRPRHAPAGMTAAFRPVRGDEAPAPARRRAEPAGGQADERQAQVGRNAALMSAFVVLSRLTGFLRTWGQAYAIGVTVMASCYTVANGLPNQLYELVVAGMLTTAFLPVYMSVKKRAGLAAASEYASNLVSIVIVLMGAVSVLGFVFAAQLVYTQSFTATQEFDSGLATYFFRFFVIEVVLYALSSIFSGILNAERDYLWSSAAPIFNNFVTTASFFAYAWLAPVNAELALVVLAVGNPLGVLVQVLVQMPAVRRRGIRIRPHIDLRDPLLRETLKIGVPSVAVMFMSFATVSVQSSASLSVTALGASVTYYARLWYTLPYAILTVPITTAMFTELSDSWAKGAMGEFRQGVSSGVGQILFYMVPFSLYLAVFSVPLICVLGASTFTPDALQMTATYLAVYATSLPFYAICMYLQKVASSMRRMGLYAWASALGTVVQVVLLLALAPTLGLPFVALTSTVFFALIDLALLAFLRRELGPLGIGSMAASLARSLGLGLLGALVGALVLRLLAALGLDASGSAARAVLTCALAGIPALVATYGAALALHVPEAAMMARLARRLTRR